MINSVTKGAAAEKKLIKFKNHYSHTMEGKDGHGY